jgi:hypothetical protein
MAGQDAKVQGCVGVYVGIHLNSLPDSFRIVMAIRMLSVVLGTIAVPQDDKVLSQASFGFVATDVRCRRCRCMCLHSKARYGAMYVSSARRSC